MNKQMIMARLQAQGPFLKVIAGIDNFDVDNVRAVAEAAHGVAASIDVSVDRDTIAWIKANTDLTVFVSSLDPAELAQSAEWGADLVELGNFSSLYDQGKTVTPVQVLDWTREIQRLTAGNVAICVTIPAILSVAEQIDLAVQIQAAGADMLQIENLTGDLSHVAQIREVVQLPILLSGRLDVANMAEAMATGADALGVGAAVRAAGDVPSMRRKIEALQQAMMAVAVG